MKTAYQTYGDFKANDPDQIYLFRSLGGAYYEALADDCDTVRSVLGDTTWTTRIEGDDFPGQYAYNVAMIRVERLESTVAALISAGYRIAVVEQVQDTPKGAIVGRVVTKGKLTEEQQ